MAKLADMAETGNKPDVVFCFAIRPSLVPYYHRIREQCGIKLVLWYPDMTERSRDRMWRNDLNRVSDGLIFSVLETAQRYRELAPYVLWMPQYFDHRTCMRGGALPSRLDPHKPMFDVCFIGSCDNIRNQWLDRLQSKYHCAFYRDGIATGRQVRGWDMAEVYAQSKIAVNIQRKLFYNPGPFVTSNRTYNAMGSGAFFINHHVDQLELLFADGIHCAMHNDTILDLESKIDYYLQHDDERERIAAAGQALVLQHHTLEQRVHEYWCVLRCICENRPIEPAPHIRRT
jgi:hypothetical protein